MKLLNNTTITLMMLIKDGMTVSDLKKQFKKDSYVSILLSELINCEILDVINDTKDRRTKIIFFTEKGIYIKLLYGYIIDLIGVKNGCLC
jgi:hypothetical protein